MDSAKTDNIDSSSPAVFFKRTVLIPALAAGLVVAAAIVLWRQGPDHAPLYPGGSDGAAGAATVPAEPIAQARALPGEGANEAARHRREAALADSLASMSAIDSARVHLAVSRISGPRGRLQPPTSASVVVKTAPGRALPVTHVNAVARMVAAGTPGLEPGWVTVVDHEGRLLSGGRSRSGETAGDMPLARISRLEREYAARIERILTPVVGAGRVRAEVSVEVNAGAGESMQTGDRAASDADAPGERLARDSAMAGRVKRLGVAVVIDDKVVGSGSGSRREPRTQKEIERISALVKGIVGFDAKRGDRVSVFNASFAGGTNPRALPAPASSRIWERAWLPGAGLVLASGLIFAWLWLGRRASGGAAAVREAEPKRPHATASPSMAGGTNRSGPGEAAGEAQPSGGHTAGEPNLDWLREIAMQDPAHVAQMIRIWIARGE